MLTDITKYFSLQIAKLLAGLPACYAGNIQEIRLRAGRPVCVTINCESKYLARMGGLTDSLTAALLTKTEDIEYSLKTVCEYSVYSYQKELSQCFVTVCGGHRVGIAGTAVYSDSGELIMPKSVSSINFRIASERIGSANEIFDKVMKGKCCGLLIVGPPLSAKTTILRDLTRILGGTMRVSLIDERSEIAACHRGRPFCDVGSMTDIFDGYSKSEGIACAVRAMSPQVIVCDEIGSHEDAQALLAASQCGVYVIATVHGPSIRDACSKRNIKPLVESKIFKYAVFLGSGTLFGRIAEVMPLY